MTGTTATVLTVVGARPNFMKAAPVHAALSRQPGFRSVLAHTGQHYDDWMSEVFFRDLGIPEPEYSLGVGLGSHAEQTARVIIGLDAVVRDLRPDLVVVVGDVNSTLGGALVASKGGIRLAHLEAGLRSFDRTMPEEVNRIVADALSDLLLTPTADAGQNLLAEGRPDKSIHFVGNVMIDSLRACLDRAALSSVLSDLGVEPGTYVVATVHRAANVDTPEALGAAIDALGAAAPFGTVLFPAHPRTKRRIVEFGMEGRLDRIRLLDPLGYLDFLHLTAHAAAVLTDSGGIQEETTVLGVPCLTLRDTTERPITVKEGTNTITGMDPAAIRGALAAARTSPREPRVPDLWDGHASERVVDVIRAELS